MSPLEVDGTYDDPQVFLIGVSSRIYYRFKKTLSNDVKSQKCSTSVQHDTVWHRAKMAYTKIWMPKRQTTCLFFMIPTNPYWGSFANHSKLEKHGLWTGVRCSDCGWSHYAASKGKHALYKLRALEFLRNCGDLGSKG